MCPKIGFTPRTVNRFAGIFIRKRLQEYGVNDRENRAVGADGERQRQYGDNREARILPQPASSEAHVPPARLQKGFPAGSADDFLGNFETSPLKAHSAKRILAA